MKQKTYFQFLAIFMVFIILSSQSLAFIPLGSVLDSGEGRETSFTQTLGCYAAEDESLVCIETSKTTGTGRSGLGINKVIFNPNEAMTMSIALSLNDFFEITSGIITLKEIGYGQTIKTVDFTNMVKNQPPKTSQLYTLTTTAPSYPGNFVLTYEVKGRMIQGGTISTFSSDSININVGGAECPAPAPQVWQTTQTTTNGVWQTSTLTQIGPAPTCQATTTQQTRTVCNSGYVVQGYTTSTAPGFKNCVADTSLQALSCGYCSGNAVMPYNGARLSLIDAQEYSWFDKFLVNMGLKSFERTSGMDQKCSDTETLAGDQLFSNDGSLVCLASKPIAHPDYFKPKIEGVYLYNGVSFEEIFMDTRGGVEIPQRFLNAEAGFISGDRIKVIVKISNEDAKIFDEGGITKEQKAELDAGKVSWFTNTIWRYVNWGKHRFGKEVYIGDPGRQADVLSGREAIGTTLLVGGTLLLIGTGIWSIEASVNSVQKTVGKDVDNSYVKLQEATTQAIAAHPLLHRAIVEVSVYSPEAAMQSYSYGRASVPSSINVKAPTMTVLNSCQPGERDQGFVQSADILLAPPIKLVNGDIYRRTYGDFGTVADQQKSIIGETGAVTSGYLAFDVKIPVKGDQIQPIGQTPISNYDADGNYYLSVAVFDRCWTPFESPTYLDKKAASFNVPQGVVNPYPDMDCCRTRTTLGGTNLWTGYQYSFVAKQTCTGTLISPEDTNNFDKCVNNEFTKDLVDCYYCSQDVSGSKSIAKRTDLTGEQCLSNNIGKTKPSHFLDEASAKQVCEVSGPSVSCFTCTPAVSEYLVGYTACPNNFIDGKGFFSAQDDNWYNLCQPDVTKCYTCDSSAAGYSLYKEQGNEWFKIINNDPIMTCESKGLDVYHSSRIHMCKGVESLAIINPENPDEWCFVDFEKPGTCMDGQIYKRKTSISIDVLHELDVILQTQGASKTFDAENVIKNSEIPICVNAVGSTMCESGSSCVRALKTESQSFRDEARVYEALRTYTLPGAVRFWESVGGGIQRWFTGESATEQKITDYGLCITDKKGVLDQIRSFLADLFGWDVDDVKVTWAMIVLLLLLIAATYFFTRDKNKKQDFSFGGGF